MLWRFFSVGESVYFNVEQECLCVSSLSVSLSTSTESKTVCVFLFLLSANKMVRSSSNQYLSCTKQSKHEWPQEGTDWLATSHIYPPPKNQFNFTEIIILAASSKRRKKTVVRKKSFCQKFFFLSKSLLVHLIRRSGKHVFALEKQICSFIKKAKFETTDSMKNVDFATFVLKLLLHR